MKTKTEHTPTPLVYRKDGDNYNVERITDDGLRSIVARVYEYSICEEHGTPVFYADLITRAVNAFDDNQMKLNLYKTSMGIKDKDFERLQGQYKALENSHEALLEAAKNAIQAMKPFVNEENDTFDATKILEKAIKQAEGK